MARIAVFSALIVILLALVRLSPVGDLFFYCGASLALAVLYLEKGPAEARYAFFCSAVIALFYPGIMYSWPYYLFFGLYPFFKFRIEKTGSKASGQKQALGLRLGLKSLYALINGGVLLIFFHFLFPELLQNFIKRLPWAISVPGALVLLFVFWMIFFYVYESCLSLLICFYIRRLGSRKP